jgi:uncharacterized protein
MLRAWVIFLIGLYQRYLSPYKGFRCAHAAWHGGPSCSAAVKNLVREHGVFAAWPRIRLRFSECRAAYDSLSAQPDRKRKPENDGRKPRRRRENESCWDGAIDGVGECACDAIGDKACEGASCDVGHCG